ncbi:glycosyltransferase [Schaalia sp. 19OD2882]|uniref:glycosyltransferase n=1 Tax=Schaalia sp. 19OD2882 TaxID=2794089 RepID=UPI001C1ED38A|nr:glycosyltransferase family 1 protein [Schaalia sp. 19OD2882]QWW19139.1 glycosyltransferase [Schaalia sp. 19OD2882]
MRIAVKRDATTVSEEGHVTGKDAGSTLVRRLLRIFPGSVVLGEQARQCEGFDVVPLDFVDPEEFLVVNMDVTDSPTVWNHLHQETGVEHPRIMNLLWWPTTPLVQREQVATIALSCALFPTFAVSRRSAQEVRDLVERWTVADVASGLQLGWVNPGFRLEHVQRHCEPSVPVVLYPSIYLSARKRPQDFVEVIDQVHDEVDFSVDMRLHETHLDSDVARSIATRDWVNLAPLLTGRPDYWAALSHARAFVATSVDESYGLGCVEAMGAGAIGIFPDREWARALLPEAYPFVYRDTTQAATMLHRVLTDPEGCRQAVDASVGGDFVAWVNAGHSDQAFERALTGAVHDWFGH